LRERVVGRNIIGTRTNYTSFKICVVMNRSKALGEEEKRREEKRERKGRRGLHFLIEKNA
jgi:hypothetical protein